jgi:hypothetical protein
MLAPPDRADLQCLRASIRASGSFFSALPKKLRGLAKWVVGGFAQNLKLDATCQGGRREPALRLVASPEYLWAGKTLVVVSFCMCAPSVLGDGVAHGGKRQGYGVLGTEVLSGVL